MIATAACGGGPTGAGAAHGGPGQGRDTRRAQQVLRPGVRTVNAIVRGTEPGGIAELSATGRATVEARDEGGVTVSIALLPGDVRANGLDVAPSSHLPAFTVAYTLGRDGALVEGPTVTPEPADATERRLAHELADALVEPIVEVPARGPRAPQWTTEAITHERLEDVDVTGRMTTRWQERRDAVRENGPVRAFAGEARFVPRPLADEHVQVAGGVGLEVVVAPTDGRGHMRLASFAARGQRGDHVLARLRETLVVWAPTDEPVSLESLRHNSPAPQTLALCLPVLDELRTRIERVAPAQLMAATDAPSAAAGALVTEPGVHVVATHGDDGATHVRLSGGEEVQARELAAAVRTLAAEPPRALHVVYVDADAAVPVASLVAPLSALAADFELRLVVHTAAATEIPAAIRGDRAARPDRSSFATYADAFGEAAPQCQAWQESARVLSLAAPDARPALAARAVPESYARCGCLGAPDPAMGVAFAQVLGGAEWSPLRWLPLPLAAAGSRARALGLARGATVADLAHGIEARPEADRMAPFSLPAR